MRFPFLLARPLALILPWSNKLYRPLPFEDHEYHFPLSILPSASHTPSRPQSNPCLSFLTPSSTIHPQPQHSTALLNVPPPSQLPPPSSGAPLFDSPSLPERTAARARGGVVGAEADAPGRTQRACARRGVSAAGARAAGSSTRNHPKHPAISIWEYPNLPNCEYPRGLEIPDYVEQLEAALRTEFARAYLRFIYTALTGASYNTARSLNREDHSDDVFIVGESVFIM
eukprot:6213215-Pleurochrysis_carterae.AAC.4